MGDIEPKDLGLRFGVKEGTEDNRGRFPLALMCTCFEYEMYQDLADGNPVFDDQIEITFEQVDTHDGRNIVIKNNDYEVVMDGKRAKFNGGITSLEFDGPKQVITGLFHIEVEGGPLVKEAEVRAFAYIEGQPKPATSAKLTIKPDGVRRSRFE